MEILFGFTEDFLEIFCKIGNIRATDKRNANFRQNIVTLSYQILAIFQQNKNLPRYIQTTHTPRAYLEEKYKTARQACLGATQNALRPDTTIVLQSSYSNSF